MTTVECPSCMHPFDVRVVVGTARATPPSVVLQHAATEVEAFLRERTIAAADRLRAAAVYADYRAWVGDRAPLSTKAFGMGMRANGVAWGRDNSGTVYSGIGLLG